MKHNEGVRSRNEEWRERTAHKQFKKVVKEEKKKGAERTEAFDKLSRKIKKRRAEEEAKFDVDTFARDVRHSKRRKK